MLSDDATIGHLLTRREAVALLASFPAGVLRAQAGRLPARGCVARPRQTEGPFFVDEGLERTDIRSDPTDGSIRTGVPLDILFKVARLSDTACTPLEGALVDVWHCDRQGKYSDVANAVGKKFLRGFQRTSAAGEARFTTIYPGWYPGRAVHVHFKIHSASGARPGFEFVSQLYFPDALTDRVHALPLYAERGGRRLRNSDDQIFPRGGSDLLLEPKPQGLGYASTFEIALTDA
jgi:protocatechuate 3,4-dioxygenase beta subunit